MLRRFVTSISDYIYLVMSGPIQVDVDEEDNGWNLDGTPMNQSMRSDTSPSSPRTGPPITSPAVKTAPTSNETPVKAFDEASRSSSWETPVKAFLEASSAPSWETPVKAFVEYLEASSRPFWETRVKEFLEAIRAPSSVSMSSYDGSPPTPPPRGIDIPVSNTPGRASFRVVMTHDQALGEINSIKQSAQMLKSARDHGDFEQCPEILAAISELETFLHKSQDSSAACSHSPLHRHNTFPRMNAEATRGSPGSCVFSAGQGVTNGPCRPQPAPISRQSLVLDVPSYASQIIRLGREDGDERWMAIAERNGLCPKLIRDIKRKGEQSGMKNTPLKMLLETREMDNYKMADLITDLEDIHKKSLIEDLHPHME